ncbi:MAG: YraN family protein [Frankiales bacterium]|nr:YraN family protein [Frankiales bacterium]
MGDRRALGAWGEDLAVRHLQAAGYDVLARNWRCREGELDIVARGGDALVFVEVKTRSSRDFGDPAEAVSLVKARRIRVLAARWLTECRPPGRPELRFDVVSIVRVPGQAPDVVHLEGAF